MNFSDLWLDISHTVINASKSNFHFVAVHTTNSGTQSASKGVSLKQQIQLSREV